MSIRFLMNGVRYGVFALKKGSWALVRGAPLIGIGIALLISHPAAAHRSGCHNLHSCRSDADTYVCGDLGYPCNGATSLQDIPLAAINVPLLIETTFVATFGRTPTIVESAYWKNRFRSDKESIYQVRRTMAWHKTNGSFGPPRLPVPIESRSNLVPIINALFRSVYDGRNPTISEHSYWASRIADKPYEAQLRGAMAWHKAHNLGH